MNTVSLLSNGFGLEFSAMILQRGKRTHLRHKTISLPTLAIAFGLLIGCCVPEEVQPRPKQMTGKVSGVVKDIFDVPQKSVVVTLMQAAGTMDAITTDAEGKFIFDEVPVGNYELEVMAFAHRLTKVPIVISETLVQKDIVLEREGLASGGVINANTISYTASSVIFELDVFVLDGDGKALSVNAGNFSLQPANYPNGISLTFNQQNVSAINSTGNVPYSVILLLDQSGSMSSTDPTNSRLHAARAFLGALGTGDNVVLAAFASDGRIPFEQTLYGNGFTTNGALYYPNLKELADEIGGNTPLYKSLITFTDYTAANGTNANKALVVLTDGQDTEGGYTINQIVSNAASKKVKIYTVGLTSAIDVSVLGELALRGNGAFMFANHADQLISAFKNLGSLLHDSATVYRLRYSATANGAVFPAEFTGNLKVMSGKLQVTIPFYLSAPNKSKG